jgi:hypothetical protein
MAGLLDAATGVLIDGYAVQKMTDPRIIVLNLGALR